MKKLIVGNLKMNLVSPAEREEYFDAFKKESKGKDFSDSQVVLCAPAVHLESFAKNFKNGNVAVGAQNIFWEDKGSYTGEISAPMVKNLGGEFVIIGHSERRKYFGEKSADANLKIKAALKNGLTVIYCVGETLEQRKSGEIAEVIIGQISEGFAEISSDEALSIVIAYEPVWAVGSDVVPTSDEILEVRILLKKILVDMYGLEIAENVKILYGGSVKAGIAKQVCIDPGMDGALVGRESLTPREFLRIVEIISVNSEQGTVNKK